MEMVVHRGPRSQACFCLSSNEVRTAKHALVRAPPTAEDLRVSSSVPLRVRKARAYIHLFRCEGRRLQRIYSCSLTNAECPRIFMPATGQRHIFTSCKGLKLKWVCFARAKARDPAREKVLSPSKGRRPELQIFNEGAAQADGPFFL